MYKRTVTQVSIERRSTIGVLLSCILSSDITLLIPKNTLFRTHIEEFSHHRDDVLSCGQHAADMILEENEETLDSVFGKVFVKSAKMVLQG